VMTEAEPDIRQRRENKAPHLRPLERASTVLAARQRHRPFVRAVRGTVRVRGDGVSQLVQRSKARKCQSSYRVTTVFDA